MMARAAGYQSRFMPIGDHRLFVMEQAPLAARGAVLLCAPFVEERLFCRRVLRHLALALANDRWHVLRFDSAGEGDSEGELSEIGVSDTQAHIASLIDHLRSRVSGPLVLVGLRWGGNQALDLHDRADALVVIDPLLSGEDYLQQLLRQNLATQMACFGSVTMNRDALLATSVAGECINVQGYDLGPKWVREARAFALPDRVSAARRLMVRCTDQATPPAWQARLDAWQMPLATVPVRPFWFEPRHHDPSQQALCDLVTGQLAEWFS